ncbi:unnamed protein product [Ceutorhynchus assimilis]|uniref:Uncharacterized protein n=1 Tax=Ceutorhynchus assimilis TaxID=467358 RepID=A0A9N9QPF3_9CUCU|nr:unnamed protein product [Ceutorhynchus assimilis]
MFHNEKDVLIQFLGSEKNIDKIGFPVILRTQESFSSSKNDSLRRNTPFRSTSQHHKCDSRMVTRRGRFRVYFKKIPQKSLRYAKDLWNTLANMQWRWLLLTVAVVNVLAYITCALLFYFDSWISGDFDNEEEHLICMVGVENTLSFFMLGIETITTVGYGYVHPTENCKLYFIVLAVSTLLTILIDGVFISVVYAKLNKPKDRNIYGQIFSKKAVISMRNGHLCLIMRVNDRDGRHWINTKVNMYLIRDILTKEGELLRNYIIELKIQPVGMLFWPVDVVYKITEDSPLWTISANEMMTKRLEILVVVSGSSVKTGQSTKSQTSYLNNEIMWGYQFSPCLEYKNDSKIKYVVNKKLFNSTIPQEVPLCSAKVLADFQKQISKDARKSLELACVNRETNLQENLLVFHES